MLVTPTPAGTMCDPELGKRRASFSGAAAARPASDSRASRPDGMARGASNVAREARGRGDGRGGRQDASAYLLRGAGPLSLSVVPFEFFSGWHSAARYWPRGQYPPRQGNTRCTLLPKLLPNAVGRAGRETDEERPNAQEVPINCDFPGYTKVDRDGRERISRPVP
jgi:hypothetical protein